MSKPKVFIDFNDSLIRIESVGGMTLTEAHSFLKDFVGLMYDYQKEFPKEPVGDYIKTEK